MANTLKLFKRSESNDVVESEIVQDEIRESTELNLIRSDSNQLGNQSLKLLDQLEKAGYTQIASKLRELQITEGLNALDPLMVRIRMVEEHIDKLLTFGHPIDVQDLQKLLSMAQDAYKTRAQALLLPYGTVSPRTALQGNKRIGPVTNVAIGIGTGVSPRPK